MGLKTVLIVYHKNAQMIYKKSWIDRCVRSIQEQTYKDFDIIEINYGGENIFYFTELSNKKELIIDNLDNHILAMNYLIQIALNKGYDIIANLNLDDYYEPNRFEAQIAAINNGAQLVSSNFHYFNDERKHFKRMDMQRYANVGIQFKRNHNPIAHPVVAYHRSFFEDSLMYNDLLGYEDLDLWKRACALNRRFVILPEYLLHYRIHENQITKTYKGL